MFTLDQHTLPVLVLSTTPAASTKPPLTVLPVSASLVPGLLPPPPLVVQTLLLQVWPPEHVPQLSVPPQPSEMLPQFLP
jgi:hypothetical protein